MKRSHLAREIVEIAAIALLILIAIRFVIQSYHVESASMQPGLTANQDFIERVIGLPGDTIQMDSTTIKINGTLLNETYIKTPINPVANIWKVPPGQYFVLNDNRQIDDDSRTWSFVPKDYIVGKAVLVYWPLASWQFVDTHQAIYHQSK